MWCPRCGERTYVRSVMIGETNIRWRYCKNCGLKFLTEEIVAKGTTFEDDKAKSDKDKKEHTEYR